MTTRWFPDEMPVPAASAETIGWWEAAAAHRLVVQRCTDCGTTRHPPGPLCPACRSARAELAELPGTGSVYTYTVVHQAFIPQLADRVPYVVAAVDLDGAGGARLVTDLVDVAPEDVHVGMRVAVAWEDMGPELALPRFRPIEEGGM
ncbi:MAG TPA: Zn-ribbon domain-containing OB-fold protein [Acidimicrobiales bacterium]|nr:Zn-ribbon domain-containing OB-fold protein [Acidimicrobiales bacterium]